MVKKNSYKRNWALVLQILNSHIASIFWQLLICYFLVALSLPNQPSAHTPWQGRGG